MKKTLTIILAVIIAVSLAACGVSSSFADKLSDKLPTESSHTDEEKTDTDKDDDDKDDADNDFDLDTDVDKETVLETDDFKITVPEGYHFMNSLIPDDSDIDSIITDKKNNVLVTLLKEKISVFEDTGVKTVDDYLNLHHESAKGTNVSEIEEKNGEKYFTYEVLNEDLGYTYKYLTICRKSDSHYWVLQGGALKSSYDDYEDTFFDILSSVEFK